MFASSSNALLGVGCTQQFSKVTAWVNGALKNGLELCVCVCVYDALHDMVTISPFPLLQSNTPHVQNMLVQAMADWYMQGEAPDSTRIARILDIAQDLKALSNMLSVNQFPFVIDLACWAAKREFLKLDKWISDKAKEHQVLAVCFAIICLLVYL